MIPILARLPVRAYEFVNCVCGAVSAPILGRIHIIRKPVGKESQIPTICLIKGRKPDGTSLASSSYDGNAEDRFCFTGDEPGACGLAPRIGDSSDIQYYRYTGTYKDKPTLPAQLTLRINIVEP